MSELFTPVSSRTLTWENADERYYWVDVGPFFDRIGTKQISVSASSDPVVQSVLSNARMRKYIDLRRPDLPSMLDLLVAANVINTDDKAALLVQRTADYERHIKGLPQPEEVQ